MDRKNMYIVIFVITTIIASCVAVYFGISKNNEIKILEEKISNLNTNENILNSSQTYKMIDIASKIEGDMYLSKEYDNVKTKIQNGKGYVAFTTHENMNDSFTKELNKYYEIKDVNGKIIDICIDAVPTSGYPIFIMLMEDGTLQKTKFVQGDDFYCKGKIEGFEDIIRIDDVEVINYLDFDGEKVKYYSRGVVATDKYGNTKLVENIY